MSFLIPRESHGLPQELAKKLIDQCEEFAHLKDGEPVILWLFRTDAVIKQGRQMLGACHVPAVQGQLSKLFDWMLDRTFMVGEDEPVDFLITLDLDFWLQSNEFTRTCLVHHELMHIQQALDKDGVPRFDRETGRMVFALRGHDVEEFSATVKRYGAWNADLRIFLEAAGCPQ